MSPRQQRLCHIFHAIVVEHCQISSAKILVHTSKYFLACSTLPQMFDNDTLPQIEFACAYFSGTNGHKPTLSKENCPWELSLIVSSLFPITFDQN